MKTISARDEKQGKLEGLEADITEKTAERTQPKMEIAELAQEIAAATKALSEVTVLRVDEKADNDQTVKEAEAGKDAVEFAFIVLKKDFYDTAFVQTGNYVPPNSYRSGKTVSDLASEMSNAGDHGRQDSSSGILGLLEVILSDFDRTDVTVTDRERTAAEKFDDFNKATDGDIKAKKGDKEKREAKVVSLTDDLIGLEDDRKIASEALADAKDQLETFSKSCVEGEETYEEREANREKEIEALKMQQISEDWKN